MCVCVCFGEMLHGVRVYFCLFFFIFGSLKAFLLVVAYSDSAGGLGKSWSWKESLLCSVASDKMYFMHG